MVWMRLVSLRRKPSLSASRMATMDTSGRSSPSRSRLMPTSTSNSPSRRSRISSIRWMVAMSECIYRTRRPRPFMWSVRSSAMRLVRVVTSTRSSRAARTRISSTRSSIWPVTGRTSTRGSSRPVGRITCSTIWSAPSRSYSPRRGGDEHRLTEAPRTPGTSEGGYHRRRAGGSRTPPGSPSWPGRRYTWPAPAAGSHGSRPQKGQSPPGSSPAAWWAGNPAPVPEMTRL